MQGFMVPVAPLLGQPGEYRGVRVSGSLQGVGTSLACLTDAPVTASLRLESVIEGILASGAVHGEADVACCRCLRRARTSVDTEVTELYVAPGHEEGADADAYRIFGAELDLEPLVRDAIGLAFPLNPLCSRECKGLCARCGQNLNTGACACADDDVDPRWAPLADLREKLASDG